MEVLYEEAGKLVAEEEDQISLSKYSYLLRDEIAIILEQVLEEKPLPFLLADFQKLAIHAIGSLQNVILIRQAIQINQALQMGYQANIVAIQNKLNPTTAFNCASTYSTALLLHSTELLWHIIKLGNTPVGPKMFRNVQILEL